MQLWKVLFTKLLMDMVESMRTSDIQMVGQVVIFTYRSKYFLCNMFVKRLGRIPYCILKYEHVYVLRYPFGLRSIYVNQLEFPLRESRRGDSLERCQSFLTYVIYF